MEAIFYFLNQSQNYEMNSKNQMFLPLSYFQLSRSFARSLLVDANPGFQQPTKFTVGRVPVTTTTMEWSQWVVFVSQCPLWSKESNQRSIRSDEVGLRAHSL